MRLRDRYTGGVQIALPRLHAQLGTQDIQRLRFLAPQSRRLLQEAGAAELVEEAGAWDLFAATHAFGACRMGTDKATSTVDAHCRSHDHPNLYITDACVFRSTGGGEAPSLTIYALARRVVDAIVGGRRDAALHGTEPRPGPTGSGHCAGVPCLL